MKHSYGTIRERVRRGGTIALFAMQAIACDDAQPQDPMGAAMAKLDTSEAASTTLQTVLAQNEHLVLIPGRLCDGDPGCVVMACSAYGCEFPVGPVWKIVEGAVIGIAGSAVVLWNVVNGAVITNIRDRNEARELEAQLNEMRLNPPKAVTHQALSRNLGECNQVRAVTEGGFYTGFGVEGRNCRPDDENKTCWSAIPRGGDWQLGQCSCKKGQWTDCEVQANALDDE